MENFYWLKYINFYKDLLDAGINTQEKALEHWTKYGQYENRICPLFEWKLYLKLNPELINANIDTKEKVFEHLFNCGFKEDIIQTININENNLKSYDEKLLNILVKKFIINDNYKIINIKRNIYPIFSDNDIKKDFIMSFDNNKIINNSIPKKIHKIFLNDTKEYIDKNIYNKAISTWQTFYHDYTLTIYDKNDAINYLNKYYGKEFIYIYNLLIPFAYKCDFLRLCILYEEGGIYSDIKQSINQRLDIDFEKYNFIYTEEKHFDWTTYLKIDYQSIQNCFIATVPKHPYIKCAIDLIIQNVLNRYYCLCNIDITGPIVLGCSINQVKKHWSYLDETLEKKIYFNRRENIGLITYVLSNYNVYQINNDQDYLIKHKFDDDCGINNWNNSLKQKNNSQSYSVSWKYNEVYVPIYNNNNIKINNIDSKVKPYKKYIDSLSITYMNIQQIYSINSFILIIDTTTEENIYFNHFIDIHKYYKTFITIKNINNKLTIICNNNIHITNILNISDIYIFLNQFFNKIDNIILWDDIPSNDIISFEFQEIINYINNYKFNYEFKIYKSFYLYSKNEVENIILINKYEIIDTTKNIFMHDIKPYMIYFPQFHNLKENDLLFYEGFTDAINLQKLLDSNRIYQQHHKIITPLVCDNIIDYNLTNRKIIEKQIDILEKYKISGLAIYYYWFSINNITNKNMIMEDVINIFFDINLKNKKIYFIWANECWTKCLALSGNNKKHIIENTYDTISLQKNIDNLIKYFNNDGYLKINNKPVLFIHHPWMMTKEERLNMYKIFDKTCILNNFDGIQIVVNSMFEKIPEFKNYYHNLNYKWNSKINYECKYYDENYSNLIVDYNEYINKDLHHIKDDDINVYFVDFDNSARLIKPDKLSVSTYLVNNTDLNKQIFLKDMVNTYKNKKNYIDKILLINGFNEWGEQMAFEPSKEFGYYNLNLLSNYLKSNIPTEIIILSGGKTGSSTLCKTLNKIIPTIQIHDNNHFLEWINPKYKNEYNDIYEFIEKNNIKYLITVNRSIFERKISGLFQCLIEPNDYNKIFNIPNINETTIDKLYDFFIKNLLEHDFENYDFCQELLTKLNKNIPSNFFDFKKKYGIIEIDNNIKLIVLRFKDINIWEQILSNIFDKKIIIYKDNLSEKKIINTLYNDFKSKIKNTNIFLKYSIKELDNKLFNECHNITDYIELQNKWTNIYD